MLCAGAALAVVLGGLGGCSGGGGGGGFDAGPPDAGQPSEVLIAFDRNGDLYSFDPTTGVETLRLDTSLNGQDIGVVSSALFLTDTSQLWLGTGGAGITPCKSCVLSLDIATGQATQLHGGNVLKGVASMARSPGGGFIYSANGNSNQLYGINPANGQPQFINLFSEGRASGGGMTFDQLGILYAALEVSLFTVDPATAVTTRVQYLTFTGFPVDVSNSGLNSLTVLGGTMYGILYDRNSGSLRTTYLVRVNPATAEVTNIRQNSVAMEGLAVVPANLLP